MRITKELSNEKGYHFNDAIILKRRIEIAQKNYIIVIFMQKTY